MVKPHIFHLVPQFAEQHFGCGTWKAVRGSQILFSAAAANYQRIVFQDDGVEIEFGQTLQSGDLVILEYSKWPKLISQIRRQHPKAKIFVRTINAEALQHAQSRGRIHFTGRSLITLYQSLRVLWRDMRCKMLADTLLGISEWDDEHYWQRIPGRAKVISVPYFCPWTDLLPQSLPVPWEQRENLIVAMPGGRDPLRDVIADAISEMAAVLSERGDRSWRCVLTAGFDDPGRGAGLHPGVEVVPLEGSPWDLLVKAKVVVMVTPYGFGNKTTVTDGLAAGCHVLLHPVLAKRQPDLVRQHCRIFPQGQRSAIKSLLDELQSPPPPNQVNQHLRDAAFANFARALEF